MFFFKLFNVWTLDEPMIFEQIFDSFAANQTKPLPLAPLDTCNLGAVKLESWTDLSFSEINPWQRGDCIDCVAGSTTVSSGAENISFCVVPDAEQTRNCTSGRRGRSGEDESDWWFLAGCKRTPKRWCKKMASHVRCYKPLKTLKMKVKFWKMKPEGFALQLAWLDQDCRMGTG